MWRGLDARAGGGAADRRRPASGAPTIASPNGVPGDDRRQLELVAAGHEDAGRPVERSDVLGDRACARSSGRTPKTSAAPSLREQGVVDLDDLRAQRGGGRDHRDPGLRTSGAPHELLEHAAPAELVLGPSDDEQVAGQPAPGWPTVRWSTAGSPRHDRKPKGCHIGSVSPSSPDSSSASAAGRPLLVVLRHGKAEAFAPRTTAGCSPTVAAREARPRGRGSASPGWSADARHRLVGATGAGDLGAASPVRPRPRQRRRRDAPTPQARQRARHPPLRAGRRRGACSRRAQPDRGLPRAPARRRRPRPGLVPGVSAGFADLGLAVLHVRVPWADLDVATAAPGRLLPPDASWLSVRPTRPNMQSADARGFWDLASPRQRHSHVGRSGFAYLKCRLPLRPGVEGWSRRSLVPGHGVFLLAVPWGREALLHRASPRCHSRLCDRDRVRVRGSESGADAARAGTVPVVVLVPLAPVDGDGRGAPVQGGSTRPVAEQCGTTVRHCVIPRSESISARVAPTSEL